ncbi:MAG: hypothetical protein SVR94_13975 [Pseudomonadota bacterium]|nr:hypothetical protein [Pseudomonadota bacterium]
MPTENTQDHQTQQEDDRAELLIKVTGAVMAVLFFFLFVLHLTSDYKSDASAISLLTLMLISGLIFSGLVKGFKWKDVEISFRELKGKQLKLEEQQKSQKRLIEATRFLLSSFLGPWELKHLEGLNNPIERFGYKPAKTFEDELRRLLSLKFIGRRKDKGFRLMWADADRNSNDLKTHFFITNRGKEYLKRRAEFDEFFRITETEAPS